MTVVPPGYSERISIGGERRLSTLSGDIRLEQNRGRLAVYDPITGETKTVTDVDGFHYFLNNQERSRMDEFGLTTIRADGSYAGRYGQAQDDERDGAWVAKPGVDLRNQGIG